MKKEDNYIAINKQLWNNKTNYHLISRFYDLPAFLAGKNSLTNIELELLGDVSGKSILHLQCHFGQDTLSLARLGAHVTGIDLSDASIEAARELSEQAECAAEFICCNIYDLPQHLDKTFDIVFTSYGTIGWLPDLEKWAGIVSHYLKPGGKFVFAEFHPVVWMMDYDFTKIEYNYFKDGAIIETESGTYADKSAPINDESVSWNHSISEVLNNLIKKDLVIDTFNEYDYSTQNCFNGTVEFEPGKYRIKRHGNKLPMVFALVATKK